MLFHHSQLYYAYCIKWTTQRWFPLLMELIESTPIKFSPTQDLLISSSWESHVIREPFLGGRQTIRTTFLRKGFDEEAAEVMLLSVQESTLNQYEIPIRLWWECLPLSLHPDLIT